MRTKEPKRKNIWQMQDAKAKLSALVEEATHYPQIITLNGRPKAVALSYRHFWAVITHYFTGEDILNRPPESIRSANRVMRQTMEDAGFFLKRRKL